MNFLCDVHIAYKAKRFLMSQGHFAIHANGLAESSETPDKHICAYADNNNFVVITKDGDFVDFYLVMGSPQRLIKINFGNISTQELIQLLSALLPQLEAAMTRPRFLIEINKDGSFTIDQKESS